MSQSRQRLLVPEVVQASATDCGPAVLHSVLRGFGLPSNYGRLREILNTDVDGTSITTLEEVSSELGLDVEQVQVPADHLLSPGGRDLPAVVVTVLPTGETHFVVVWRRHGRWFQIMDPSVGRRWIRLGELQRQLFSYAHSFEAAQWREWAGSDEFLDPMRDRLKAIGVSSEGRHQLIATATNDHLWVSLAALDAAIRLTSTLVASGAIQKGERAESLVGALFPRASQEALTPKPRAVPPEYWTARPDPDTAVEDGLLRVRGALLIRLLGPNHRPVERAAVDDPSDRTGVSLGRSEASPWRTLWQRFRPDRSLAPRVLLGTVAVSAMAVVIEALLFNALLDLGTWIEPTGLRTAALLLVGIFLATTMALELLNGEAVLRIGRQLETRLRSAFLSKVPRLGDRFFRTRLRSDMAERGHSAYALRGLPVLATDLVGTIVELAFTVLAMAILFPQSAPIAVVAAILAVCLPVAAQPLLGEQDLRLRNQTGALSRYYLDALLGHTAVRAHGAERVVRREHANLLRKWHFSGLQLLRTTIGLATLQSLVGFGLAASIVLTHLRGFGPGAGILLLTYWALKIPALGHRIVGGLQRLPYYRSLTVRTLEPLAATEETDRAAQNPPPTPNENGPPVAGGRGVSVDLRDLSIQIGGQLILDEVGLSIEGGRHVAILGRSGAGKSTLVGALLGWSRPATGTIVVDGLPLTGERLDWLRQRTVWIDPSVQLWNQSLIENLRYGSSSPLPIGEVLSEARLDDLLNTLPRGLDTSLGEGGGLVSGGEGQRVRFGRGLGRPEAELVILDEPFRGLGADAQRVLLTRARRRWRDATLLCVTHDLQAASTFETVVVMENGKVRESGSPADLLEDSDSLYRRLVDDERKLQDSLWTTDRWRRLRIGRDGLREMTPNGESP